MRLFSSLILIASLLIATPALAHGGNCACSAFHYSGIGGPILTLPAYTMQKGRKSISAGFNYIDYGRLSLMGTNNVINSNSHADDNSGSLNPSLSMAYGLTDNVSVFASMPYRINLGFREINGNGIENQGDSIGFGDFVMLGQYKFFDRNNVQMALLGGMKFPTGQTHVTADTGERFETKNQPGTGSFDPIFGASMSKQFKSFGMDLNFMYKLSTEGAENTTVGDVANYAIAFSRGINHNHKDPFHHHHLENNKNKKLLERIFPEHLLGQHLTWDVALETIAHWEEKPETNGLAVPNHGGTTVSVYPGLRMTINDLIMTNFSIGIPIIQVLEGDQGGTNLQMVFNVGVNF